MNEKTEEKKKKKEEENVSEPTTRISNELSFSFLATKLTTAKCDKK